MTARHGDLFHRSVALTAAVDDALEHLAEIEDTSRSHLMREALSMLFADRGIDVDATEGVQTNPLAVAERRKRRKAPPGDSVRAAFTEWWRDHARELTTASSDALLVDLVAGCVIEHIEDWRIDYNINRPHSAHGDLSPAEFAAEWTINQPQAA